MKAEQFLRNGADVLAERGKEYDKPEGERSMARCVAAFNAITGHNLTEASGWLLLQVLKDVRQWQNPDRYHEDSAVDCVNYAALKAEALSEKGSDNIEVVPTKEIKPDWLTAPSWATVLIRSKLTGQYEWAEKYEDDAQMTWMLMTNMGRSLAHDFAHFWSFVEHRP